MSRGPSADAPGDGAVERPVLGLLPRLIIGLVLALMVAFSAAFLVDRELTRDALRQQGEEELQRQLELVVREALSRTTDWQAELAAVKGYLDIALLDAAAPRDLIRDHLNQINHRRHEVAISAGYSRAGEVVLGPGSDQPVPPSQLFDDLTEQDATRVVEVRPGVYAYVAAKSVGRAPDDWILALGQVFDTAFAQRLRDATGGIDVVLQVGGKVVGTSLAAAEPAALAERTDVEEVSEQVVGGKRYWIRYQTIATAGPYWGQPAAIGVMVPEPLATLDARLIRSRVTTAVVLLVLVAVMAWS